MMKSYTRLMVLLLSLTSCMSHEGGTSINTLENGFIITEEDSLAFMAGDVVAFKISPDKYGSGFIGEVSKDEGGIWYKFIFSDLQKDTIPTVHEFINSQVFGRKVLSSLYTRGYVLGLDGEFVLDSCIFSNKEKFILMGKVQVNKARYRAGSYGASSEYADFISRYDIGLQNRNSPPEDYRDVFNSKRTEEYFPMSDFLIR